MMAAQSVNVSEESSASIFGVENGNNTFVWNTGVYLSIHAASQMSSSYSYVP
jgi:hypothetical protein